MLVKNPYLIYHTIFEEESQNLDETNRIGVMKCRTVKCSAVRLNKKWNYI